jgi:hypothetical protein
MTEDSPIALTVLTNALEPHMADPPATRRLDVFSVSVDVLRALRAAGLRIVDDD